MKTLKPGIILFENVFLRNEELIEQAENGQWRDGFVGNQAKVDSAVRITDIHDIDQKSEIHQELLEVFLACLEKYIQKYTLSIKKAEHLRVARYPVEGYYKPHADAENGSRQLSGVLFLNEDFQGGELNFIYQDLEIKPKAGDLLLFPSNFIFRHECKKITEGNKFLALTWFSNE